MKELPISIYSNAQDNVGKTASLKNIFNAIKGERYKNKITAIREADTKEKAGSIKKTLPAAVFSGTFEKRSIRDFNEGSYTHIVVMDIDGQTKTCEDQFAENKTSLEEIKRELSKDAHTLCVFTSPSGNGLKVLTLTSEGPSRHLASFKYIKKYYEEKLGLLIDPSGKDISRMCFLSSDDDMYLNYDAAPFNVPEEDPKSSRDQMRNTEGQSISDDLDHVFRVCVKFVEKKQQYFEGNRNNFVHHLGCTLNRAGIDMEVAITLCLLNYDLDEQEATYTIEHAYKSNQKEFGSYPIYDWGTRNNIKQTANLSKMDTFQRFVYDRALYLFKHGVSREIIGSMLNQTYRLFLQSGKIETSQQEFSKAFAAAQADYESTIRNSDEVGGSTMTIEQIMELNEDIIFNSEYASTLVREFNEDLQGGYRRGDSYALIGPPGADKSNYAIAAVIDNAKKGIPSLYVNGEMGERALIERLVFKEFRINLQAKIKYGQITRDEYLEYAKKISEILDGKVFINSSVGLSTEDLAQEIAYIKETTGVEIFLVVIDGIGHLAQPSDEIGSLIENGKHIKEFAKTSDVAVLTLCHTTTGVEQHKRSQHDNIRGGMKMLGNFDAFINHSKLININQSNLEKKDYVYHDQVYYSRLYNKRGSGKTTDKIINVEFLNIIPDDMLLARDVDAMPEQELKRQRKLERQNEF